MKHLHTFSIAAIFALAILFAASSTGFAASKVSKKISVTSSAFKNGGAMPAKYAFNQCEIPGAGNISPPLQWKVSSQTAKKIKSFAITVIDPHPTAQNMVHMFAADIPSKTRFYAIVEGAMPKTLLNGYGERGWGGPCPPPDEGYHPYIFTVYGLNVASLNLDASKAYTDAEIKNLLKSKIVAKGKLTGKFDSGNPAIGGAATE